MANEEEVEYDPKALEDAVDKMHAHGTGDDDEDDPTHDHDDDALDDAEDKMKAE